MVVKCKKCNKEVDEDNTMEADDGIVCDKCAVKHFAQCDGCGLVITKSKPIEVDGYELCPECSENWEEEEDEDFDEEDEEFDEEYDDDDDDDEEEEEEE